MVRRTVVMSIEEVPIRVGNLGEVVIGAAPRRGDASANGRDAIVIGIQKQPVANTLELTRDLDRVLGELESGLPAGMTIHRDIFRQADFIEAAIDNLTRALRDGAILVIVIVFLFLANSRAASITLVAMPLSLLAAVLAIVVIAGLSLLPFVRLG